LQPLPKTLVGHHDQDKTQMTLFFLAFSLTAASVTPVKTLSCINCGLNAGANAGIVQAKLGQGTIHVAHMHKVVDYHFPLTSVHDNSCGLSTEAPPIAKIEDILPKPKTPPLFKNQK